MSRFYVLLPLCLTFTACSVRPKPAPPLEVHNDEYGCAIPSNTIFTQVGFDFQLMKLRFPGFKLEGGEVHLKPEVIDLVDKATRSEEMLTYLKCRVRNGYPEDQADWYSKLDMFERSLPHPNADQTAAWQKEHPSPYDLKQKALEEQRKSEAAEAENKRIAKAEEERKAQEAQAIADAEAKYRAELPYVQLSIDWMWGKRGEEHNPPSNISDMFFMVTPGVMRGVASARDCVVNAAFASAHGDNTTGTRWLMAGEAHDDGAQANITKYSSTALRYARAKSGI